MECDTERYCRECDAVMPIEKFAPKSHFCREHYKLSNRSKKATDDIIERYCMKCHLMLPIDNFTPKSVFCRKHKQIQTKGKTPWDIIRLRCWTDKKAFGHPVVKLPNKSIRQLLRDYQLSDTKAWAIVPIFPTRLLTPDNAAVVTSVHRRYLMAQWKLDNDEELYQHILHGL